jgi:hypothetical protein
MEPIVLYHGAQRWQGPPRLQPAGKNKSEMGSGLYLTTSYATARKYAKGGGVIMRFFLSPDLTFANNTKVSLLAAKGFLRSLPRLRGRDAVLADLEKGAERVGGEPFAYMLENLMLFHGGLKGDKGPALASFLVEQGIDASLVSHSAEDWVVLYNLDKILSYGRVSPEEADYDRPRIRLPSYDP